LHWRFLFLIRGNESGVDSRKRGGVNRIRNVDYGSGSVAVEGKAKEKGEKCSIDL